MNSNDGNFIHISVVDYNPKWPVLFQDEAKLLQEILQDNLVHIFHIGSTSVPGLKAKPIIDIMPVVVDIARLDCLSRQFAAMGYEVMGEFGLPGRRYFRKGGKNRTHQIHAYQYDDTHNIIRHVAFRDYLRHSPDVCNVYGALKAELAVRFPTDIDGYCDGKEQLVRQIEQDALQWYWRRYETAK